MGGQPGRAGGFRADKGGQSMTYAWMETVPTATVFSVAWVINAPWAHPLWSQYLVMLYDLTSPHSDGPPTLHLPDATHEFIVHALDPEFPVPKDAQLASTELRTLMPPNYGYQFKAASNEAAQERVQMIVDGIVAGHLSPDTDFRSLWNKLLPDAFPLVR
jgi:hypothetical protein